LLLSTPLCETRTRARRAPVRYTFDDVYEGIDLEEESEAATDEDGDTVMTDRAGTPRSSSNGSCPGE
jgi:hypothetical protein